MSKPAILGGKPVFTKEKNIPILRPTLPDVKALMPRLKKVFKSGQITNASNVKKFEALVAEYLGVKYCIAMSSCTSGLILVQKCLGLKAKLLSRVLHFTPLRILFYGII